MHSRSILSKRFPTAMAVAGVALLALPASGVAADKFGSRFANSPNTGGCGELMAAPCTYVSFIHPAEGTGDPYAGGAPSPGVITKFRISAYGSGGVGSPATVTFRLADIARNDPDAARAATVATGPTVTIAGSGEIEEFPARVPVRRGNHLAIDTSDANAIYASSGSDFTYVYSPPLVAGAPARTSGAVTEELLVGASYERDADKDGYGDETQDQCPGNGSDAKAPCTRMALKVERVEKGREVRGKCKRQTAANRSRKPCKRYVKVGTVKPDGKTRADQIAPPRKVGGRKLAPGRYRLTITRHRAGKRSTVKRIGYRIER